MLQTIAAFLKINRTNADNRFMYSEQGNRNRRILQEQGEPMSHWGLFPLAIQGFTERSNAIAVEAWFSYRISSNGSTMARTTRPRKKKRPNFSSASRIDAFILSPQYGASAGNISQGDSMKNASHAKCARATHPTRIGGFILLSALILIATIMGCKSQPESTVSDDQKALASLANSLPKNFPPDQHVAVEAGLDGRTRTISELVDILAENRDWTESMAAKQADVWQKSHLFSSPPVIIHDKQADAAYRLKQFGPQAKAAAPAIIQLLTNSESLTLQWASHQKNIDAFSEKHADALNRHWAIQVLQSIGSASPKVVPALVSVLHEPNDEGYEAANALIIISATDTNVLPLTIAKLESDPGSPQAKNSVRVVNGIGPEATAAVPILIRLLDHTNACDEVVRAFSILGSNAAPAVPSLLNYYKKLPRDEYFAQRRQVVIAFGRIGPGAQAAVPALKSLQNRTYESFEAIRALWRIDPQYTPNAIAAAQRELSAQATMLRSPASALLGEIGGPAKSAVPLLLQKLDSTEYPGLAFNAAWALWRIDPSQKAKVASIFEDFYLHKRHYPYQDLSLDAAGALWQIEPARHNEFRPAIVALLKDWKTIPAVHHATPEMTTLLPALQEIANDPEYSEVRPWAILAIRVINEVGMDGSPR